MSKEPKSRAEAIDYLENTNRSRIGGRTRGEPGSTARPDSGAGIGRSARQRTPETQLRTCLVRGGALAHERDRRGLTGRHIVLPEKSAAERRTVAAGTPGQLQIGGESRDGIRRPGFSARNGWHA